MESVIQHKHQAFVIELNHNTSTIPDYKLVYLGGCQNPSEGITLVQKAYENQVITHPYRVMIVPTKRVFAMESLVKDRWDVLATPNEKSTEDVTYQPGWDEESEAKIADLGKMGTNARTLLVFDEQERKILPHNFLQY